MKDKPTAWLYAAISELRGSFVLKMLFNEYSAAAGRARSPSYNAGQAHGACMKSNPNERDVRWARAMDLGERVF